MLRVAPGVKVYLACQPVDIRRGFDGLSADVARVLAADPYSGAAFVFRGKRGDYVKILPWDGSGLCLFAKRLEKAKFVWPPIVEGALQLTPAQLALLLEGIDWRRTVAPQPPDLPRDPFRSAPFGGRSAPRRRMAEGRGSRQGADDREAASAARQAASRPLRPLVGETQRAGRAARTHDRRSRRRRRRDARACCDRGAGCGRGRRDQRVIVEEAQPSLRAPLPDHLPKETIVHEAPCVCPTCGGEKFDRIGADEREVLECAPSHFKRVVHVRPKMSCRACETIIHAPMPTLPIEKGPPGPALLAHGAVSKFCDHLPLHRQADIYARQGVAIDRSVMAAWMGHLAALLEPLSARIERHVRAGIALHADDTLFPVLDPGRGRTKTGRLWTAVRDERPFGSTAPSAAFYRYSPDRKADHAHVLLAGCCGFLHADGYAGFADLYEPEPTTGVPCLTEVACWAHARRKIYDVHAETGSPAARETLERIARLFAVEANIRGRGPADRRDARRRRSAPILAELKTLLDATLATISGKSSLAGAIRPLALAHKNYLFASFDAGGRRAAILYPLIETCSLNDIDPEAWLADVIARIADHPINRLDELLPWKWSSTSAQSKAA